MSCACSGNPCQNRSSRSASLVFSEKGDSRQHTTFTSGNLDKYHAIFAVCFTHRGHDSHMNFLAWSLFIVGRISLLIQEHFL